MGPLTTLLFVQVVIAIICVLFVVVSRLVRGKQLVPYEPRRRVPWNGWDVLAIVIGTLLLHIGASQFAVLYYGIEPGTYDPRVLPVNDVANFASLALACIYLMVRAGATGLDLGANVCRLGYDLMLGVVGFLAALLPIFGLQALLTQWFKSEHPLVTMLKQHPDRMTLLLATFTAVIVAPLTEEFLFRVVLQGWLEKQERAWRRVAILPPRWPRGTAPIVLSSAVFALMHLGHGPDPIPLFFLAMILGYLYYCTHRIWPSVVLHACLNGLSMATLWLTST